MQCIGKYGHINVIGLVNLMPAKRPKNTIYQRTRALTEWGYTETVIDKHKNKIFRLSQRGVDELGMRGVTVRGRSLLQCDLARIYWALEQAGFIETLGLEAQPTTKLLDAVSKGEAPRVLIVDNPYQHIANTFQRLEDFVKVASKNAPLDIIALTEQRAAELQRYVDANGYSFTVVLQTIDI
jgi:DNA-binding PadR family transcriptional regulator